MSVKSTFIGNYCYNSGMNEINSRFGAIVRKKRGKAGLTQEELASAIGLSRTAVTNVESGKQGTTIDMLYRMADAMNVEPADLLPSKLGIDLSSLVTDSDAEKIKAYLPSGKNE